MQNMLSKDSWQFSTQPVCADRIGRVKADELTEQSLSENIHKHVHQ